MRRSHLMNFVVLAFSGVLIVAFQNCSRVKFDAAPASLKADQDVLISSSKVLVDDGAEFSNQRNLAVSYISPRASEMKRSTTADCSDGDWEKYTSLAVSPVDHPNATNTYYAQFRDLHGNTSDCVSDGIVHDDKAPTGVFVNPPDVFTNLDELKVAWSANDNLSGIGAVICKDNAGTNVSCSDYLEAKNQIEGVNSIRVQLRDRAGNESPELVYSWFYDKTKPVLTLNEKPASLTSAISALLDFSAVDTGSGVASYNCKVDTNPSQTCLSPLSLSALLEGAHHLEITAKDKAGNVSDPIIFDWKIDLTAPNLQFVKTPAILTNATQALFSYVATDDGEVITNFQCSLDGAAFSSCGASKTVSGLAEGSHTFKVRALDSAGNISQPISYTWGIDLIAPTLAFVSTPGTLSNVVAPLFTWNAKDASGISSVVCTLDGNELGSCPDSSKPLSALTEGEHKFQVAATDAAGNVTKIVSSWMTDFTAPVVTIASGPAKWTKVKAAAFEFSAADASGIDAVECKIDSGSYAGCGSPLNLQNLLEGGHALYVRATDKAGNVSVPEIYTWATDYSAPLIRIVSSPATLLQGGAALVQYEVADTGSGLSSVICGLTSPSSNLGSCDALSTADLGQLNQVGAYVFEIRATDNVGNTITEVVTLQVTNKPTICDPFSKSGEKNCNGGFLGEIFYLTDTPRTNFKALSSKSVDFFYSNGTKVDALLNLKNIFVPTRSFTEGFPTQSGSAIVDNNGNLLNEYFAFRLNTVAKLDPLIDQPGWYQVATLSDDGSMLNYKATADSAYSVLVANDGDHSSRLGCSSKAIYVSDASRIPMQLKYYQGPRTSIAMVMLWRKVDSETAALDSFCGYSSSSEWFGPAPYLDYTTARRWGQLTAPARGWKVMSPTNFVAPSSYTN